MREQKKREMGSSHGKGHIGTWICTSLSALVSRETEMFWPNRSTEKVEAIWLVAEMGPVLQGMSSLGLVGEVRQDTVRTYFIFILGFLNAHYVALNFGRTKLPCVVKLDHLKSWFFPNSDFLNLFYPHEMFWIWYFSLLYIVINLLHCLKNLVSLSTIGEDFWGRFSNAQMTDPNCHLCLWKNLHFHKLSLETSACTIGLQKEENMWRAQELKCFSHPFLDKISVVTYFSEVDTPV